MCKYLKLTADNTGTTANPGVPAEGGEILINLAFVVAVYEFYPDQDKAPLARIWLSHGGMLQVRESASSIRKWVAMSEMSVCPVVNDDKEEN